MLCRLHTVYKIIHCAALHTLCDITQRVSNYYTVKWQFFAFNLEKITPGRKCLHRHRLWCLWQIWGMVFWVRKRQRNLTLLFNGRRQFNCLGVPGLLLEKCVITVNWCLLPGLLLLEKWCMMYVLDIWNTAVELVFKMLKYSRTFN